MKKLFGEGGFKGFLAQHVEKLLLGLTLLIALLLIWSGFRRDGIRPDHDPAKLNQRVQQAQQHVEQFTWDDFREERQSEQNFKERASEALQEMQVASYGLQQMLKPPYQPPRTMRTDPEIYPPEQLQVCSGFGSLEKMQTMEMADPDDPFSQDTPRPGMFRGEGSLYGGEEVEGERPIPTGRFGMGMPEGGRRMGGGGVAEGKYFVVITGLVPYRKQVQQYNDCLANSAGYDPARDLPYYDNWMLQRTELVPGQDPKWKTIGWKQKMVERVTQWGTGNFGINQSYVPPECQDPALTMPLIPLRLTDEELDRLVRHREIERYTPNDLYAMGAEGRRGAADGAADEPDDSQDGDEPDLFAQTDPMAGSFRGEGGFRPGLEGGMMRRMGEFREPGMGPGGIDMRSDYSDEGSMMARPEGRMGVGMTGQIIDPERLPEYKMFRYIDLDVRPNVTYQYRLKLRLEDPNDPNTLVKPAPAASTLDRSVQVRLTSRKEPPAALKKMGLDHIYYRDTEPSEPSEPVKVTDGRRLLVGDVTSIEGRSMGFPRPGEEPSAKVMALEFDARRATDVPGIFEVRRGTVANKKMDVEVPLWSEGKLKLEENYQFRLDTAVIDIEGGRALGVGDLKAPGEVLIYRDGQMIVVNELENRQEYEKFDFPPEEQDRRLRGPGFGGDGDGMMEEQGRGGARSRRGRRGRPEGGEGGLYGDEGNRGRGARDRGRSRRGER